MAQPQPIQARQTAYDEILATAKRLFAMRGFDGVSIQDVALESGASKANIFHHFGSKQGLYDQVLRTVTESPAAVREDDSTGAREFLMDMAVNLQQLIREDDAGIRLVLAEIISSNPNRARYLVEYLFQRNFTDLIGHFRRLQNRGEIRGDADPALIAFVLNAAILFLHQAQSVVRHLPGVTFADDFELYAEQLVELLLNGCEAREPLKVGAEC